MDSFSDSESSFDFRRDSLLFNKEDRDQPPFFFLSTYEIWDGIKSIAYASFATSLSLLFIYSVNLISLAYISTLENAALVGGIGLGFVCSNCCAYILITSIDQGVNALAAQAFGAKKHEFVSLYYHRGLFTLFLALIPIFVLLGFTKPFLIFFGMDMEISEYAWEYIKYAYPSYFFYGIFDCTKSYLYAQKIFKPILYTQTVTTILHLFWGWLFIAKLEMGCSGAGIAKNIYELSNMIILLIYVQFSGCCKDNWMPFSKIEWRKKVLQLKGMKFFFKVITPMAALLFLDMACYEMFTIFAGQFGEDQLAVHVGIANSATLYYSIPLGMSVAVMTYVGNAIGNKMPNAAKNYAIFGVILNIFITFLFATILWLYEIEWATLFSPDQVVKNLLLEVLHIYLLLILFDGIQVTLSGALKGINRQTSATISLIISYYFVALPVIYVLAFRLNWKVRGIWIGFLVGIACLLIMYLFVLTFTDFKTQTKKIRKNFKLSVD